MGAGSGKVAVVTGASRGVGRGVALALGDEGYTVYVSGRTAKPGSYWLSGSIVETAAEVDSRGGKGIPVQCDHGDDAQVATLFAQVKREQGRIDLLVNNAFALPEDLGNGKPFWEKPPTYWDAMVDVGARSNYIAAWHAAQMMVPQTSGLIVCTSGYVGVTYTFDVAFGACKAAVDRTARDMAIELKPYNVVSLSMWLGPTFTERAKATMEMYKGSETTSSVNPDIRTSVELPGRVIAALAKDPDIMKRSGGTFIAVEMARDYGVVDIDGKLPKSLRALRGSPIWSPI